MPVELLIYYQRLLTRQHVFRDKYATIAVKHGHESEACDTLRRASLARVFYHDESRKIFFKLLLMGKYNDNRPLYQLKIRTCDLDVYC